MRDNRTMQKFRIMFFSILIVLIIPAGYWHVQIMEFLIFFYFDVYLTSDYTIIGIAIISPFLIFIGIIGMFRDVTKIIPSITRNPRRSEILTIIISISAVVFVVYGILIRPITISYNDLGIILQIMGFIIYVPHVTTFLLRFVDESEQEKSAKQIIKTAAISLVVIGLVLQISSFHV